MSKRLAPLLAFAAAAAALIVVVFLVFAPARAEDADRGFLADLISRALSSPSNSVAVGAVSGALSSDVSIDGIVLSDRQGPWLRVGKVRLVWSRLALLRRRLEINQLTIADMEVLRRPLPAETPPPETGAQQPILPELPVKVIIGKLAIDQLSLGEPVIGVAARLNLAGRATLGPPSEGLDLSLTSKRLDAGGAFKASLSYVPTTDKLTISVASEEPAGGLFVHLVNLPGLPPAKFSLEGSGPLDNFDARLDFAAGADVWARGDVAVARQGSSRRLTLNLNSRLEGMTPPVIRPVFAGETTLQGDVLFNPDASVATPGLHLVSANARLDIEGSKSADDKLDVKIHAGAIPGATQIGKLDLNATIAGAMTAPTIEGAFDAGDVRAPEIGLERVVASFHAHPSGALTEKATRVLFEGRADMKGLKLADPTIAEAVGSEASLTMRGSTTTNGEITFDALDLSAPKLDAGYAGLFSSRKMRGRATLTIGDLGRFSRLAGGKLAGEARATADLDGAPGYGLINAVLDARVTSLVTPFALLDKVLGGELAATGAMRTLPGGGFGFSGLKAAGKNGSARIDGEYRQGKADLTAAIDIPQAKAVDPRVDGKITVAARLTGAPDDLAGQLEATLGAGRLLDRRTSGIALNVAATRLTGPLEAKASLTGDVDGQPLSGSAHVVRHADGGFAIDGLGFALASARLTGEATLDANRLANAELAFSAKNLNDLSPLALTRLGGALEANVSASAAGGRQALAIKAVSDRMSVGDNRLEGLKLDLAAADLWGARAISGTARIARAEIGGQQIADVRLTATPGPDFSDLDVSSAARGLALKARGRLSGAAPVRLDLQSLSAEGRGRRIVLSGPASLAYGDDGLDIRNLKLAVDSGRIAVDGRVGEKLDLKATATGVPLAAADLAVPGLGLSGYADAEATIGGTADNPAGDWRVRLRQVSAPQVRAAGLPALDLAGAGRLSGGRTTLEATVNAGPGNSVRIAGSAPLAAGGALDLRIDGRLDAGLANVVLSTSGRHATGAVTIAMRLAGTPMKPDARGTISLSNGTFRDDLTGFRLSGIGGLISANGDLIRIDRLSGTTPNGGTIAAGGEVRLDPAAGFPGTIRVTGKRARVVANDIVTATADLDLALSGKLAQAPRIDGRIAVNSMDITVPSRLGASASPIPGTRHLNPTPTARARLAALARASASRGGPAFDATLALVVSAANRVYVRGRGIDAELGGDVHIAGTSRSPQITGGFDLLRGSLTLIGHRLTFTRGTARFHGDVIPDLDLVAETSAGDVTARIEVTGPADQPAFAITSSPSLPQDEILSRILFERGSGNLSPFQAIELADAVSTLTGGTSALEGVRRSLGLSSLNFGTGTGLFGLGRAINDRISVGVTTGVRPQDNGVNADIDLTRHIRLQGGVDATGGTSIGVGAEWEYK